MKSNVVLKPDRILVSATFTYAELAQKLAEMHPIDCLTIQIPVLMEGGTDAWAVRRVGR